MAESTETNVEQPPRIIDVRVSKFNPGAIIVAMIMAAVLLFGLCVVTSVIIRVVSHLPDDGPWQAIVGSTLVALVVCGAALLNRGYRNRWIEMGVHDFHTGHFGGYFRQLVEEGHIDIYRGGGDRFVKQFVRRGLVGSAVRLQPWDEFTPITPLAEQFEPRLILEGSDDFDQFLRDDSDGAIPADRADTPREDARRRESRTVLRTVGRNLGPLLTVVMLVVATVFYATGGASRGFAFIFALIAIAGLAQYGLAYFLRTVGKQWLAVPGGIIIRRPRGLGTRSSLHLMQRSNSMILATRHMTAAQWRVTVSDGKLTASRAMSSGELVFALRAWTSPLAPPVMERLTDWIGER